MKKTLIQIYERDILKFKDEISKYKDERTLWITAAGIRNSAGNLCLHLVGNLNHFIGAVLGKNGYQRERDKEFSLKDIPADELMNMIDRTRQVVVDTLSAISEKDLALDFPQKIFDQVHKTDFVLMHLLAHLNYHLGQINYHRRLLEK
ncbi:MAG: DinB family protein [Ferruginibacter sp.]